MSIGLWAEK